MHPRFPPRDSPSPAAEEKATVTVAPQLQPPMTRPPPARRLADEYGVLPVFDPRSAAGRREMRRLREADKRIHLVPLVVLLCLFMLWWFSYPVTLEMVEGRVVAIYRLDLSSLNDTFTLS